LLSAKLQYTRFVANKLFITKFVHALIFWWQAACLGYTLYSGISGTFNYFVLIAVLSILLNGLLILFNRGRCPFTTLAEDLGAERGSVTHLFLPDCLARNIYKITFPLFTLDLVLLAVRFFTRI
jgi:hypothetical protein